MEIFKRKENYVSPVNTAKRNFQALGFLYIIVAIIFFLNNRIPAGLIIVVIALIMFTVSYLLERNMIYGSYLGLAVVIAAFLLLIMSILGQGVDVISIISILILLYVGYWNNKALTFLKTNKIPD